MTTKCTGLMGRIFGHNFRPVTTKGEPSAKCDLNQIDSPWLSEAAEAIDMSKPDIYHGSICQRCGAVTGEKR